MDVTALLEPVLQGGIYSTNFYNGRPLTADDLKTEQSANRARDAQLGRAIGEGVVHGYEITRVPGGVGVKHPDRVLRIEPGLAVNRLGEAVALPSTTYLELVPTEADFVGSDVFVPCGATSTTAALTNYGFYVLAVRPAADLEGRSPVVDSGCNGVSSGCEARFSVEGAQFRLSEVVLGSTAPTGSLRAEVQRLFSVIDSELLALTNPTDSPESLRKNLSMLRNIAAHLFLGTEKWSAFGTDALPVFDSGPNAHPASHSNYLSFGLLDDLFANGALDKCDVPLALIYWSRRGIEFVDWWAVRRPIVPPVSSMAWGPLVSDRFTADRLALFLQFQHHLEDLVRGGFSMSVKAREHFRFLPPVILLQFGLGQYASSVFLDGILGSIPSAKFNPLTLQRQLREGINAPFIDLGAQPAPKLKLSWIALGGTSTTHMLTLLERVGPGHVIAESGPYAVVAAGRFNIAGQPEGPTYNGLIVTAPLIHDDSTTQKRTFTYLVTFAGYVPPSSSHTYLIKDQRYPQGAAEADHFTFDSFVSNGIRLKLTGQAGVYSPNAKFTLEITRIGTPQV